MEQAEAIKKKNYLENKIVYLRLITREGAMIKDPKHIGYGGFDGAITGMTIYYDTVLRRYIDPFKSDDEREFFEKKFGVSLSVLTNNPFWDDYRVKIIKDSQLVHVGMRFDLSTVEDALAIRVLRTNKSLVCEGWERRFDLPTYKYAIVEEGYQEVQAANELDLMIKIGEFFGAMQEYPQRMRDFLNVYYSTKHKKYEVSETMTKEGLKAEVKKIIDMDRKGYLDIVNDVNYETKIFIAKAVESGLIRKEGVGTYYIVGANTEYSYDELIREIDAMAKEKTDPIYLKMIAKLKTK